MSFNVLTDMPSFPVAVLSFKLLIINKTSSTLTFLLKIVSKDSVVFGSS
jgi:hypothetical protein